MESPALHSMIRLLSRRQPRTLRQLRAIGVRCKRIDRGAYRFVLSLPDFPGWVLKVPTKPRRRRCILHGIREANRARAMRRCKKLRVLRRYAPEVAWFSRRTGVVLMRRYRARVVNRETLAEDRILRPLFREAFGARYPDFGQLNFCVNGRGRPIAVDLGIP